MARTFEEVASRELDVLYQGALFLHAGDPDRAEALLIETLTDAAEDYPREEAGASVRSWLEGRLARSYLGAPAAGPGGERPGGASGAKTPAERLLEAAGRLPPLPRAALWLVLLRRWSYADACAALGVERARLDDLLAYRDVLFARMMGDRAGGTGTLGEGWG